MKKPVAFILAIIQPFVAASSSGYDSEEERQRNDYNTRRCSAKLLRYLSENRRANIHKVRNLRIQQNRYRKTFPSRIYISFLKDLHHDISFPVASIRPDRSRPFVHCLVLITCKYHMEAQM